MSSQLSARLIYYNYQVKDCDKGVAYNRHGEMKSMHNVWVGKFKELCVRLNYGWNDNIKIDLKNILWSYGPSSTGSLYGSIVVSCEHGNEHSYSIKGRGLYWVAQGLSLPQKWLRSIEFIS